MLIHCQRPQDGGLSSGSGDIDGFAGTAMSRLEMGESIRQVVAALDVAPSSVVKWS